MIRRRPIPKLRPKPEHSLRYQTSADGSFRTYFDYSGNPVREVCQENAAGRREYARRVRIMVERQNGRCSLCNRKLAVPEATFEHHRRRGMGGAFRDDRITEEHGLWVNSASHWICNGERG
jgi:hypothetical protein